jgi:hypothetical protein
MVLTVGLALLLAAVLARGSRSSRALVGVAGAAWLATSSMPAVVLVHQAVLWSWCWAIRGGCRGGACPGL